MSTTVIRIDKDMKEIIDSSKGNMTTAEYLGKILRGELPDPWLSIIEINRKLDIIMGEGVVHGA